LPSLAAADVWISTCISFVWWQYDGQTQSMKCEFIIVFFVYHGAKSYLDLSSKAWLNLKWVLLLIISNYIFMPNFEKR
jgi:hypothetical protein